MAIVNSGNPFNLYATTPVFSTPTAGITGPDVNYCDKLFMMPLSNYTNSNYYWWNLRAPAGQAAQVQNYFFNSVVGKQNVDLNIIYFSFEAAEPQQLIPGVTHANPLMNNLNVKVNDANGEITDVATASILQEESVKI